MFGKLHNEPGLRTTNETVQYGFCVDGRRLEVPTLRLEVQMTSLSSTVTWDNGPTATVVKQL